MLVTGAIPFSRRAIGLFLVLFFGGITNASAAQQLEFSDALKLFLIPISSPANVLGWDAGATADSSAAVDWTTDGVGSKNGRGWRHAEAIIAIDGKPYERLAKRVEPLKWTIDLYGPHAGPYLVEFGTGLLQEAPFPIVAYLTKHGINVKLAQCAGAGTTIEAMFRLTALRYQPANLYAGVSCGASNCSQTYELGYFGYEHIADFDNMKQDRTPLSTCRKSSVL